MQKRFLTITIFSYAFLYLPIIFMVIGSFSESSVLGNIDGFSLRWYQELLSDKAIINSLFMSLRIAFISASFSVIIATIAAIYRLRSPLSKIGISIPIIIPDTVMGLSLLLLFVTSSHYLGIPKFRGVLTISIAHITLGIAYTYILIRNRIREFDRNLIYAALDLGASRFKAFLEIMLPLIFPTLFSSWLLAFTLSFDDLILSSFLSGPGTTTLPMNIFSQIKFGVTPKVNALATIMVSFVIFILIIAQLVGNKISKKYS